MYVCRGALGASGLALHDKWDPYKRRNEYISSGVIMTLELVAQVDSRKIVLLPATDRGKSPSHCLIVIIETHKLHLEIQNNTFEISTYPTPIGTPDYLELVQKAP